MISCFYKSNNFSRLLPILECASIFNKFVINILQSEKQYLKKNNRSAKIYYPEKLMKNKYMTILTCVVLLTNDTWKRNVVSNHGAMLYTE